MVEGGRDEEVASSKKECKNQYPIYDQTGGNMAKIYTLFMTKTAETKTAISHHSWLVADGSEDSLAGYNPGEIV